MNSLLQKMQNTRSYAQFKLVLKLTVTNQGHNSRRSLFQRSLQTTRLHVSAVLPITPCTFDILPHLSTNPIPTQRRMAPPRRFSPPGLNQNPLRHRPRPDPQDPPRRTRRPQHTRPLLGHRHQISTLTKPSPQRRLPQRARRHAQDDARLPTGGEVRHARWRHRRAPPRPQRHDDAQG